MGGDANGNSTLSSYDVIDRILTLLSRRDVFPNLRHVVLAGHSAGGVFVHLYSITNRVHEKLPFSLSYVVSNPSSCTISRNGPARFRVNGPTLHGLPAEPRFGSSTRPFSLRQVFWL